MRLQIPTAYNALDQDVYAPGGALGQGVPTDAWLGRQIGRNDRKLHAVSRRSNYGAFPAAALPRLCDVVGCEVYAEQVELTPGTQGIDWYLRGLVPVGQVLWALAWCEQQGSPQPWGPIPHPDAVQIVGPAGPTVTNFGPIPCRVRPGPATIGITVWSMPAVTFSAGGTCLDVSDRSFRGAAAAFGAYLGVPTGYAACLTAGAGGVPGATAITPLHQVTRIESSGIGGAVNDVAVVWPATLEQSIASLPATGTVVGWQLWQTSYLDLYSWTWRERQLTGTLGSVP